MQIKCKLLVVSGLSAIQGLGPYSVGYGSGPCAMYWLDHAYHAGLDVAVEQRPCVVIVCTDSGTAAATHFTHYLLSSSCSSSVVSWDLTMLPRTLALPELLLLLLLLLSLTRTKTLLPTLLTSPYHRYLLCDPRICVLP